MIATSILYCNTVIWPNLSIHSCSNSDGGETANSPEKDTLWRPPLNYLDHSSTSSLACSKNSSPYTTSLPQIWSFILLDSL